MNNALLAWIASVSIVLLACSGVSAASPDPKVTDIRPNEILCRVTQSPEIPSMISNHPWQKMPVDPMLPKHADFFVPNTVIAEHGDHFAMAFVQWKRRRVPWMHSLRLSDKLIVSRNVGFDWESAVHLGTVYFHEGALVHSWQDFREKWSEHSIEEQAHHQERRVFQRGYRLRGEALQTFLAKHHIRPVSDQPLIEESANNNWELRIAYLSFHKDTRLVSKLSSEVSGNAGDLIVSTGYKYMKWIVEAFVSTMAMLPRQYYRAESSQFSLKHEEVEEEEEND